VQPETRTQKLFRLWYGPLTNEEIAEELGVSPYKLTLLAKQQHLPKRAHPRYVDNGNPRPGDPTPDEIRAGIAEVQADWSEDERLKRFQGKKRVAYIPPQYEYDGRAVVFNNME